MKKADLVFLVNNEGKIVGAASQKAIDAGVKVNDIIKESATILGGEEEVVQILLKVQVKHR